MRSLARSLVRDDSAADDLVQEAWVDALRSPPVHGAGLRGWLATILRRRARDAWRSESRRAVREEAAARPEGVRSAAAVVAEADLHRRVVEAVMALEEPYRGTLLLRFYEQRSPADIAESQGIPAATVHTRIRRGLERLRARLDGGTRGGRTAWVAALLPLAGFREAAGVLGSAGAATAATGGVIVGTKMVVAAAVLGAAAGTLVTGLAAGTLGGGGGAPAADSGAGAEVAALRARLEALEGRAAVPGAGASGDGAVAAGIRMEALERRIASLEEGRGGAGGQPPVDSPAGIRPATPEEEARARTALDRATAAFAERAAAEEKAKETVEELRRRACDPSLPVEERTSALTGLRFAKDGVNDAVVAAMIDLFRTGPEPGFRAVILRDLHKNRDERLRALFLDALQNDASPFVRKRAAEDIDTWKDDAEVRIALERARDGDGDEEVRKQAGETLEGEKK